ncbi:serine/threonine-protein kinase [Actinophytocola sediminis]
MTTACVRPGCQGTVDETSYCDSCGHAGRPGPAASNGESGERRSSRRSDPLIFPVFDFPDPSRRLVDDLRLPSRERRCANRNCQDPSALPPRMSGYCQECGTPFSFLPSLRPGDLVGDQYRVAGRLAHGGQGWVYLANDTHLDDNPVVLKGLIDVDDVAQADAERQALTTLNHPNIVRIYNFVTHPDEHLRAERAYIVMEYVDGLTLSEVAAKSRHGEQPLGEPLRIEHVLMCGLQLLAALDYLHGRGLLYCDLKPDNVIIRSGQHGEPDNSRVKLIDLGGVRAIGDRHSPRVGTHGFQVPDAEIERHGLTVRSDLYTVGETLHRLYLTTADRTGQHDGAVDKRRIARGVTSFHRICDRAVNPDPHRRFSSAAEMAEQCAGVLREIASLRDGVPRPERSARFAPAAALLDAGLGVVPSLLRWTERTGDQPLTDAVLDIGVPTPEGVAAGLPEPLVSPDDPAADVLAAAPDDMNRLRDKLAATDVHTVEAALARCRAGLIASGPEAAMLHLHEAAALLDDEQDWRLRWHAGLIALGAGDVPAAEREFGAVYDAVAGEDAPKLALAFCAEHGGDPDEAESYYEAVWQRDRSVVSAVFGLARIRLASGDRAAAVRLLDETPELSRHFDAAGIAAVRVLSGNLGGVPGEDGRPSSADLDAAESRLSQLYLDNGARTGDARTRLATIVRETELGRWLAARKKDRAGETALRRRLEHAYRGLARQSETSTQHADLVDLANTCRPITFR